MNKGIYHKAFEVHTYDTDVTQSLSLIGFANYLQDAASSHADQLGLGYDFLIKKNQAWVLRQLKIETFDRVCWKDQIFIETWPKLPDGLLAYRDFRVSDAAGHMLARASSSWLLIGLDSRRPVRMHNEMFRNYRFREENVFEERFRSMPKISEGKKKYETTVHYSNLDMNRHVNNVVFIQWVMDAFYMDHTFDSFPNFFEIQYSHEVFMGDAIGIYEQAVTEGKWIYSIVRMKDQISVALARMTL